jgi:hypothetical protein
MVAFSIIDSTTRTRPSPSKGVVDGERPLKFPYDLEINSRSLVLKKIFQSYLK